MSTPDSIERNSAVVQACARWTGIALHAAHLELIAPGAHGAERSRLLLSGSALAHATSTLVALQSSKAAIVCGVCAASCEEFVRRCEGATDRHPHLATAVEAARGCAKACHDFASSHRPRDPDAPDAAG